MTAKPHLGVRSRKNARRAHRNRPDAGARQQLAPPARLLRRDVHRLAVHRHLRGAQARDRAICRRRFTVADLEQKIAPIFDSHRLTSSKYSHAEWGVAGSTEERRVGRECVSKGRSRWYEVNSNKKQTMIIY